MDITDGNGNRVGLAYEYGIPFNAQGFEEVSFGNSGNITVDIYLKRSVGYLEDFNTVSPFLMQLSSLYFDPTYVFF